MGAITQAVNKAAPHLNPEKRRPSGGSQRRPMWSSWAVAALFGLALGLRLYGLGSYPLWHDEAWVAVSVSQTSIDEMFFFQYPQVTPPLLLLMLRGIVTVLGPSDWVFRLWPAVAGAVAAPVLYMVSVRLTASKSAGLIAMSLWAVNPIVLRYSQELKQYTTDAVVGLLLILVTERTLDRAQKEHIAPRLGGLTVLAVVAIGLSHVAVFFIVAVTARIAWHLRSSGPSEESRRTWIALGAFAATTSAVFLASYRLLVHPQLTDWVVDAWNGYYMPWSPLDAARFLILRTLEFFPFLFTQWSDGVLLGVAPELFFLAAASGVGLLILARRRVALYYTASLFGITLLVSAFDAYPYGGRRTDLFLTPFIFMAIGYALSKLAVLAGSRRAVIAATLALVVFPYLQVIENGGDYGKPNEDVESVAAAIARVGDPSDAVGVHAAAFFAYQHYASQEAAPVSEFGTFFDSGTVIAESELSRLIDSVEGLLWLVFSRDRDGHRRAYSAIASERCVPNEEWAFEDAAAYLYDCASA